MTNFCSGVPTCSFKDMKECVFEQEQTVYRLLKSMLSVISFHLAFQTSFPGNLHLILVLRPTGLSSTAPSPSSSTDLGFRFSQDDFLLKMPVRKSAQISFPRMWKGQSDWRFCSLQVVMLRSVGELLRYIDENHLASDFAAKVEYCQSDWIVLRTVRAANLLLFKIRRRALMAAALVHRPSRPLR